MIQIGGLISRKAIADFKSKRNLYPVIKRPFKGQMAGFFFNDVRVFELAVAGIKVDVVIIFVGKAPSLLLKAIILEFCNVIFAAYGG